jgi:hypothetical protein
MLVSRLALANKLNAKNEIPRKLKLCAPPYSNFGHQAAMCYRSKPLWLLR